MILNSDGKVEKDKSVDIIQVIILTMMLMIL